MLLECRNCGAPLDVAGKPEVVKCGYCGMSSSLAHLKTLNAETPKGWQRPREWRPPNHVPADSSKTYQYRNQHRFVVVGAAASVLVVAAVASFAGLQRGGSVLPSDGSCPPSFTSVTAERHECTCGSGPSAGSVWGSGIYTADSSVCRAALHVGAIGHSGGRVVLAGSPGCSSYAGSTSNGVASSSWGNYHQSFYFVGFGDGSCAASAGHSGSECPGTFAAAGAAEELRCTCSAGTPSGSVWGSSPYTTDSSVCAAALHAGAVPKAGGEVRAKAAPGCSAYPGSTRNGVSTSGWGQYGSSFYFVGFGSPNCGGVP